VWEPRCVVVVDEAALGTMDAENRVKGTQRRTGRKGHSCGKVVNLQAEKVVRELRTISGVVVSVGVVVVSPSAVRELRSGNVVSLQAEKVARELRSRKVVSLQAEKVVREHRGISGVVVSVGVVVVSPSAVRNLRSMKVVSLQAEEVVRGLRSRKVVGFQAEKVISASINV
jgi:hypothetical protein